MHWQDLSQITTKVKDVKAPYLSRITIKNVINMSVNIPAVIKRKKLKNTTLNAVMQSTRDYYHTISDSYIMFYDNWIKAENIFSIADYKEGYGNVAELLIYTMAPKEGVLDIGCGVGMWSTLLAQHGAYVFSLDYALNPLLKCKERAKQCKVESRICILLADGFYLPFREQTFDGVTLNWVISHTCFQRIYFLKKGSRVVRDNGWLFISDSYWRGQEGKNRSR